MGGNSEVRARHRNEAGSAMIEHGKRLGHLVECPKCRTKVDPKVHSEVSAYLTVNGEIAIPERVVVKCPRPQCMMIWYIPKYRIEEMEEDAENTA